MSPLNAPPAACPLAVFSPVAGALTETFIRRHVEALLPQRTVAVCRRRAEGTVGWAADVPQLETEGISTPWPWRSRREFLLQRFLRRHGVRVILSEYLDVSLQWLDLARQLGIPFYAHAHGYDVSRSLRDERWATAYRRYAQSDGVITMSDVSRRRLVAAGVPSSRVHVIPYGVDVEAACPVRVQAASTIRCVAAGRFVVKKGPLVLLDAFTRALAAEPGLRLDVIGAGPLLPDALEFVRTHGLEHQVTLHGARPHHDVLTLMRGADLFLQHSLTDPDTGDEEGLPVAILEAMADGLPVVSTRHAAIPEAVDDGGSGYLVPEGDAQAMADRIVALARDPAARTRMGAAGWRTVHERFSWERERAALLQVMSLS